MYRERESFVFEVFHEQAVSFKSEANTSWINIGISWKKRYFRVLEIYVNGEPVKTFPVKQSFTFDHRLRRYKSGILLHGNVDESDLVFWKRYLFPFEVHRFLGISGTNERKILFS